MPRDITVTFDDGSTHVYKNAPDDVTPDAITAVLRAKVNLIQGAYVQPPTESMDFDFEN